MKPAPKRLRWVLIAGAAAVGLLVLLAALGILPLPGRAASGAGKAGSATRSEPQPVAVTVAPVTPRPIRRTVQVVGTFYGQEEVTITPKVEGRVLRIRHDVGDPVKPGDVLLEIEDVDHRLSVAEAQRALELELAKIGLPALPKDEVNWNQIPTVARARSVEENARLKLDRAQRLRTTGSLAQEEHDQAASDYRVAAASKDQAVMDAQATLAAARHKQAALDTARQRLADTKVVVPPLSKERQAPRGPVTFAAAESEPTVEYVVAQRMVSEGEMVRAFPSVAVFRLVMDRTLKLMTTVPERYVGDVKVGQPAEIQVEAYPQEVFQGTVARVNPTVDRSNRTFQIEVQVPNEARKLRAGSFAKAAIFLREDPQALTVPEEALVTFAGVIKVFVVRDGKAHTVRVEPAARVEVAANGRATNWVEVRGELPPDSEVVTTGHSQLAEGTPVRVRGR